MKHVNFCRVVVSVSCLILGTLLSVGLGFDLTPSSSVLPLLKDLHAECTGQGIRVILSFNKPFPGIAYSNGHYETEKCRYITHENEKENNGTKTNFSFLIPMNECGTVYHESMMKHKVDTDSDDNDKQVWPQHSNSSRNDNEVYIENTLLIQSDPTIQEAGDLTKTLRCVWPKEIHQPLVATLPIRRKQGVPSPQKNQNHQVQSISKFEKVTLTTGGQSETRNQNNHFKVRFQRIGQVQPVQNEGIRKGHGRSLWAHDNENYGKDRHFFIETEESSGKVEVPRTPVISISQPLPLRQAEAEFLKSSGTIMRTQNLSLLCLFIHVAIIQFLK